jgi:hypothetical protein
MNGIIEEYVTLLERTTTAEGARMRRFTIMGFTEAELGFVLAALFVAVAVTAVTNATRVRPCARGGGRQSAGGRERRARQPARRA